MSMYPKEQNTEFAEHDLVQSGIADNNVSSVCADIRSLNAKIQRLQTGEGALSADDHDDFTLIAKESQALADKVSVAKPTRDEREKARKESLEKAKTDKARYDREESERKEELTAGVTA
jgi:hypothetical protein